MKIKVKGVNEVPYEIMIRHSKEAKITAEKMFREYFSLGRKLAKKQWGDEK